MQDFLKKLIPVLKGEFLVNAPLRNYTTFHIGGPADIIIFPRFIEDVQAVIKLLYENNIKFIIMGNGSNLLVKDEGFHGAVILLKKYFNEIIICDEFIEADSGAILPLLSRKAQEKGLSGLEFAINIPATIGGAVHNNASGFGQSIADIVDEVDIIDKEGKINKFFKNDLKFSYRSCKFPVHGIIIRTKLHLKKEDSTIILKRMKRNVENRNNMQPVNFPSAGSVFKNPQGDFAGRLIESAGLKGKFCGKAQISEKHANFIINTGGAKASDVLYLIELAQKTVLEKTGIKLEREIEIIE